MNDTPPAAGSGPERTAPHETGPEAKVAVAGLDFWYGDKQALFDIDLDVYDRQVTAFIGPSGCGKTTLLRCLNRTNEIIPGTRMEGKVLLDGEDIYDPRLDVTAVRKRFGWVAQKPNPFPWSVHYNVAYGARIQGLVATGKETDRLVQRSLEMAGMWEEVKDRLQEPGTDLSGGQQQRLCIARAIATNPEVILMDEPCSALDPVSTARVEDLIDRLRADYAIVIVTHNMQQAARISQRTAFFHLGKLVEAGDTQGLFMQPRTELCQDYITGRYG